MNARSAASPIRDFGLVGIGGAIGTLVRHLLNGSFGGGWLGEAGASIWVTFSINVSGAFLLGLSVALLAVRHPRAQLLLGTGLLGGFTTYSLFAADVAGVALRGEVLLALALGLGTVVVGGLGSYLGSVIGSAMRGALDDRRDEQEDDS